MANREEESASGIRITMTQTLWLAWARIAESHAAGARQARESDSVDRYFVEFCDGVVAITAVAMSCEALQRRLSDSGPVPDAVPTKGRRKVRAIDCLSAALNAALQLPSDRIGELIAAVEPYYDKRNQVAHFVETPQAPVPHPAGGNTSVETFEFRAEEAEKAVAAMHDIYQSLRDHPSKAFASWSMNHAHALPTQGSTG